MGQPTAAIGPERDRNLGDFTARQGGLEDHLAGELHARRGQVQIVETAPRERPKPAMGVAHPGAEKCAQDCREDRIADMAVFPGHRVGLDLAAKARAHAQVVAVNQRFHHGDGFQEVIGAVRVAHDEIAATRGFHSGDESGAVSALGHRDHARAGSARERLAAVGAAVVGDDDLAIETEADPDRLDRLARPVDACRDRRRLVQARHDDRDAD